jgi:hypothetical protein
VRLQTDLEESVDASLDEQQASIDAINEPDIDSKSVGESIGFGHGEREKKKRKKKKGKDIDLDSRASAKEDVMSVSDMFERSSYMDGYMPDLRLSPDLQALMDSPAEPSPLSSPSVATFEDEDAYMDFEMLTLEVSV